MISIYKCIYNEYNLTSYSNEIYFRNLRHQNNIFTLSKLDFYCGKTKGGIVGHCVVILSLRDKGCNVFRILQFIVRKWIKRCSMI